VGAQKFANFIKSGTSPVFVWVDFWLKMCSSIFSLKIRPEWPNSTLIRESREVLL